MNEHSGDSTSAWMAMTAVPSFPALTADLKADVCVIGAGISGLTTAYLAAKAGQSVVVLDDGPIISGETERTTAHLSTALDDTFVELERLFGEDGARLAAESHAAAIDTIERIVREESIDCEFERVDGYLFNPPHLAADSLHRELAAIHRAGLENVELADRAPLVAYNTGPALLFPNQGQIHPLKYLVGIAQAFVRLGGRIFSHTHAMAIRGGTAPVVECAHGWRVESRSIVVATNTPVNDRLAIHTRQRAYRTYVIGVAVPVGTVPKVMYWDTDDPYHYVRLETQVASSARPARDLLIVGGEDHETGQSVDADIRYERLEEWTRERFPMAGEVLFSWSGQILEPVDSLAYIGRDPAGAENVYIATGDSGHGMTHGTIAGLLLTDLILGRTNRWEQLYSPARMVPPAAGEFVRDNAAMASQYLDWITPGDATREDEISAGSGAVIRRGLTKIAVYRDEFGQLHECSASCPHLGGIVRWNATEKTWDCPVHGSRFDCDGHVVNGPANTDLAPTSLPHRRTRR